MKRILEVQKEIGTLSKNAKNPFFQSAYLDLTDLLTHVTPLLNAKGLIILQPLEDDRVSTSIIDSVSGDVIASSYIKIPSNINNIKDPKNNPEQNFESKERQEAITRALASLNEGYRTAIILHRYQGLSYKEIAAVMETSVSSVESILFRAKKKLAVLLSDYLNN